MYVGGSLFLIALGAILRYAVADLWAEVDLPVIGLILMVVGAIGLVISLLQMLIWNRRRTVEVRRPIEY
jgi:hypothetical protein